MKLLLASPCPPFRCCRIFGHATGPVGAVAHPSVAAATHVPPGPHYRGHLAGGLCPAPLPGAREQGHPAPSTRVAVGRMVRARYGPGLRNSLLSRPPAAHATGAEPDP